MEAKLFRAGSVAAVLAFGSVCDSVSSDRSMSWFRKLFNTGDLTLRAHVLVIYGIWELFPIEPFSLL